MPRKCLKGRLLAMKKSIVLTALILAALIVLVGCSSTPKIGDLINDALQGKGDEISDIFDGIGGDLLGGGKDDNGGGDSDFGKDTSLQGVFFDYQDTKGDLILSINRTLINASDSGIGVSTSLVSIFEIDANMWPAYALWEDDLSVSATGRFMGNSDIEIVRSKNHAVITYLDENQNKVTFTADYDEAKSHYKLGYVSANGDRPTMELIRTSYGMAGQSFTGGLGMLENLYLISIQGDKGMIGVIHDTTQPAPLTGQEAFDFPKMAAAEWYQYENGQVIGVGRDGQAIDTK